MTMRAIRLRSPGGPEQLVVEDVATPRLGSGEAMVRVHAAAITRDELEWPVDRLPAIPAYERSGVDSAPHVVIDDDDALLELAPVDLVFDTVGGDMLARSPALVRPGGKVVSVAEEPPSQPADTTVRPSYFVVEPNRDQLTEIGELIDRGDLRPEVDSVFPLAEARAAFARSMDRGKRGKVVLRVVDD